MWCLLAAPLIMSNDLRNNNTISTSHGYRLRFRVQVFPSQSKTKIVYLKLGKKGFCLNFGMFVNIGLDTNTIIIIIHTHLTHHVSVSVRGWCLVVRKMRPEFQEILLNREAIKINQDPLGMQVSHQDQPGSPWNAGQPSRSTRIPLECRLAIKKEIQRQLSKRFRGRQYTQYICRITFN